jgi:predicted GIY-YIG superfamily endonuclease
MIGYIYHIKNVETGKEYIGQTNDIEWRIYKHFQALKKGEHHSTKLQRSYNKHGREAFQVSYREIEVQSQKELELEEIKEIAKYDSYNNGYNETKGGEGHATLFDYETLILLYQIGQKYEGVKRKIARYFHCDPTSITAAFRKDYLAKEPYNEDKLKDLIQKIGITQDNLIGQNKRNWDRKLTEEQVLKILSVIEIKHFSQSACAKAYGTTKDIVQSIISGRTYKKDYELFQSLSQKEKEKLAEEMCNTTEVIKLHYEGQRGPVKNPLTQEQVNYILDNQNKISKAQIARDLKISADRVSSVTNRKSYLDMIWTYEKEHSSN